MWVKDKYRCTYDTCHEILQSMHHLYDHMMIKHHVNETTVLKTMTVKKQSNGRVSPGSSPTVDDTVKILTDSFTQILKAKVSVDSAEKKNLWCISPSRN